MRRLHAVQRRLDARLSAWLAHASLPLLRISVGLVFLGFGLLKFVPDLSPAEDLARRTTRELTFDLIPDGAGLILVAALETAIGLSLLTGRYVRFGLALLALAMVGILAPLLLFPGDLFARRYYAPTLEGQYVLKDVVLLAAALAVAADALGGQMVTDDELRASEAEASHGDETPVR